MPSGPAWTDQIEKVPDMNDSTDKISGKLPFAIGLVAITLLVALLSGWGLSARIAGAVIAPGVVEVPNR